MNFSIFLDRIFPPAPTLEHIRCSKCGDVICRCATEMLDQYLDKIKPLSVCPVCKGEGRYYHNLTNSSDGEVCHGCDGKGWVR